MFLVIPQVSGDSSPSLVLRPRVGSREFARCVVKVANGNPCRNENCAQHRLYNTANAHTLHEAEHRHGRFADVLLADAAQSLGLDLEGQPDICIMSAGQRSELGGLSFQVACQYRGLWTWS